jgi:hypothetical protein
MAAVLPFADAGCPACDGRSGHGIVSALWHHRCSHRPDEEGSMLWTIFVILLVLWLLGMVSSYTLGGFIHVLLVIAIVVVLFQLISGRRAI